jgi:hypothetical protein
MHPPDSRPGILAESLQSSNDLYAITHLSIDTEGDGGEGTASKSKSKKDKGKSKAGNRRLQLLQKEQTWATVAEYIALWHPQLRFLVHTDARNDQGMLHPLPMPFEWTVARLQLDGAADEEEGSSPSFHTRDLVTLYQEVDEDAWQTKANEISDAMTEGREHVFANADTTPLWRLHVFVRQQTKRKGKKSGVPKVNVDLLVHFSHGIGDGMSTAIFAHDLARATSLVLAGERPSLDEAVTALPADLELAVWGTERRPTFSQRATAWLSKEVVVRGGARFMLKEPVPLMPGYRDDAAVCSLAWTPVKEPVRMLAMRAAVKARGLRPNAALLAASVFVGAAIQHALSAPRKFAYGLGFLVAVRSDDRSHTPMLHAGPTDLVLAPTSATLEGKVAASTSFWALASRLQGDADRRCVPSALAEQESLLCKIFPHTDKITLPRGVVISGNVGCMNLGKWPYDETAFDGVTIDAVRLNQSSVGTGVIPGIVNMWLSSLPNGAHTWGGQYARPAFPTRQDAAAFIDAVADLVLDLPVRAEDTTIHEWIASLDKNSPFLLYAERVRAAGFRGKK